MSQENVVCAHFRFRFIVFLLSVALLCVTAGMVYAQDAPDPPRPPMFAKLFPLPTGMNGYEEWVQACDLIQNNKRADVDPDATLT